MLCVHLSSHLLLLLLLDKLSRRLLVADPVSGECVVICFNSKHNLTLSKMSADEIERVIVAWRGVVEQKIWSPSISYVQLFENRGEMVGCSNPHPHGQAWCTSHVPDEPLKEIRSFGNYFNENDSCLLCDYALVEMESSRLVFKNQNFMVVVPWWATVS